MKPLNIVDVARTAGVSTTTVSRVLNRVPTVTAENRKRVEAAITKLHFHPNVAAQRLASGRTKDTVGLIIPRFEGMFDSFYAMEVIKGVGMGVERLHLDLLLHITTTAQSFIQPGAAGGLLFADIYEGPQRLERALEEQMPCVVLNHYVEDLPVSCVTIDNVALARQVVAYLAKLGHQEIATITGKLDAQAGLSRLDGYVSAMRERGLAIREGYIQRGDYTMEGGRRAAEALLARRDRPTAIFAASDEMALAVMEIARRRRLRVPEDVSVVGVDDNPIAANAPVPLTTIHQSLANMARTGLEILHQHMTGKRTAPLKVLLPTRLIERSSCRRTWIEPA